MITARNISTLVFIAYSTTPILSELVIAASLVSITVIFLFFWIYDKTILDFTIKEEELLRFSWSIVLTWRFLNL